MAASVCSRPDSDSVSVWIERSLAETMPSVTVGLSPRSRALPMASTSSPTCRVDVSASASGVAPWMSAILSTATSWVGSVPTTVAASVRAVGERDGDRRGAVDHVVVGQHVALVGDDEARAGTGDDLTAAALLRHVDRHDGVADLVEHAVDVERRRGGQRRRHRGGRGRGDGRGVVVGQADDAERRDGGHDGAGDATHDGGPGAHRAHRARGRAAAAGRPRGERVGAARTLGGAERHRVFHDPRVGRRPSAPLDRRCGLPVSPDGPSPGRTKTLRPVHYGRGEPTRGVAAGL